MSGGITIVGTGTLAVLYLPKPVSVQYFSREFGQIKSATLSPQTICFGWAGVAASARGWLVREVELHFPKPVTLLPQINESHSSAYFSPSEFRSAAIFKRTHFSYWVPWKPMCRTGQNNQGRESRYCGDFIAETGDSCHFGQEELKTENQLNSRPPSSSVLAGSAASGVKSDDKCAPASNISPEINAQNIRATEIENAWPYTS